MSQETQADSESLLPKDFHMVSIKTAIATLAIAAASFFSAGSTLAETAAPAACEKCKPVPVKVPVVTDKGRVIGETVVIKMNCPGCTDPITTFLNTGKFEHACSICGDKKQPCATH